MLPSDQKEWRYLPGDVDRLASNITTIEENKDRFIETLQVEIKELAGNAGAQAMIIEKQNQITAILDYYDLALKRLKAELEAAKEHLPRLEAEKLARVIEIIEQKRAAQKQAMKAAWVEEGGLEKDFEELWPGLVNEILKLRRSLLADVKRRKPGQASGANHGRHY